MKSEDRFKMLRGIWQIFTLLSVLLIVFGSGWGTVVVLLGLSLMTLLATFMILKVGLVDETAGSEPVKAKRGDIGFVDPFAETIHETDDDEPRLAADDLFIGDDGELVSYAASKVGQNTNHHFSSP